MRYHWSISMGLVLLCATPALAKNIALSFDTSRPDPTANPVAVHSDALKSRDLKSSRSQPQAAKKTSNTGIASTVIGLSFSPKPPQTSKPMTPVTQAVLHTLEALFHGGSHSLVARAVGSAEGTRTPDGGYTAAYYGHVDPGNHKWNLGSFSYQHGASSPAEADALQLKRLYSQALELRQQASQQQMTLSLAEELNGIDLANQAPLAALDRGYIDWLAIAKQQPMAERDRIIWARTRAFLDPDSGRWDAPGLGNTLNSIRWDQARRQQAVQQATNAPAHP
ncbi:hypothetical protein N836_10615 [Leptolyngbya sp. Heron Island J]|uniref:hypothetical protein n=1 Tax=Leptolyngbya sp. Heron Island J TaxID=1385935 RepID=UPI0003B9F3E4|nr:hypothetical protein [Leptolyngbya sp. Heron Island J]ESA35710.1 hypothetical protein N836_10615 [Leptolyngbya sp. Heron Island J]